MPGRNASGGGARRSWPARTLLAVALVAAGFAYGFLAARTQIFPYSAIRSLAGALHDRGRDPGSGVGTRWHAARTADSAGELTDADREEMERLLSLGYLTGSRLAGARGGVTVHDAALASAGPNLFVSGHAPEATVTDMDGRVLHRWTRPFRDVWPDREIRAHVTEEGDLYAIFQWLGLVKLDRDSEILWSYDGGPFNDLFVADDGTVTVMTHETRLVPRWNEREPVVENFLVVLDRDGRVASRHSLLEALERSSYAPLLDDARRSGDFIHGNTVEVLDGTLENLAPAFRAGNVLTSFRELDAIAVIDLEAGSVVWALTGQWRAQHQPSLLTGGRVLLFNNLAGDDVSEVLELDALTQEVLWSYRGDALSPFYSEKAGSCQRLPNGNTLIVESDGGRAFEVTTDGAIVWEFVNPYRAGEDGELIATLFDLVRLPADFPLDWIAGAGDR